MAEILTDSELNQIEAHITSGCSSPANCDYRSDEKILRLIVSHRALAAQLASIEEREAAVCPEDVGFDEYIRALAAERDELQTERDDLKRRIDSWFGPNSCSVCGGYPLASGRECICGGKGTMQAEFEGLRQELFNDDERIRTLESACEAALKVMNKIHYDSGPKLYPNLKQAVEQMEGAVKNG